MATIPAINSNPDEGASFPNYYLGGSGPSRETGGALIVLWKGQRDRGHLPALVLCLPTSQYLPSELSSNLNAPTCACDPTIIGKDACMNLPLHRNMLDKTLFIVGAGFSCHAGMPLVQNLRAEVNN